MIVTIDGPAGSGKSTAARSLAARLGFDFLDTGAMYRAVAWKCLKARIDPCSADEAAAIAEKLTINAMGPRVRVDGADVTDALRTSDVSTAASQVAAIPAVRAALVQLQRKAAAGRDIVTEGRDQGTVVFPAAECKFYITAAPPIRAQRRHEELAQQGQHVPIEELLTQIIDRDTRDRTRDADPLRQADDAERIDTSEMTSDDVVLLLESIVRSRIRSA